MKQFNSHNILEELKEHSRLNNGNFNMANVIKEDIMKISLEISSVETIFGKLCNSFNCFLSNANMKDLNDFYHGQNKDNMPKIFTPQQDSSMDAIDWGSVDQMMYCLKMHFESIKNYHQFMNKFNLCKDGVEYIGIFLQGIPGNCQEANFPYLNGCLKDCLLIMLNISDIAEDIFENYLKITAIHNRIRNTEEMPAKVLINCCFDKIEFRANETVSVLHKDFETNLWKVEKTVRDNENTGKVILNLPSLFLIFDGFDKEIIDNCTLLKRQIVSTWQMLKTQFKKFIVYAIDMEMEFRELSEIGSMDRTIPYSILDYVIKSLDLDGNQSRIVLEYRNKLMNNVSKDNEKGIFHVQNWNSLQNIIRLYNDIDLYKEHFKEIFNENHQSMEYIIILKKLKYVTRAYISNMTEEESMKLKVKERTDETDTEDKIVQENESENNEKITNLSSKTPSYQWHLYESSMKPISPVILLNRPNPFVAEATSVIPIIDIADEVITKKTVNLTENYEMNDNDLEEYSPLPDEGNDVDVTDSSNCDPNNDITVDILHEINETDLLSNFPTPGNVEDHLRKRKDLKEDPICDETQPIDSEKTENTENVNKTIYVIIGWLLILLLLYLTFRRLYNGWDNGDYTENR